MRLTSAVHANQAPGHIGKTCLNLTARPLLAQHDCAASVKLNNMKRVLADMDADYGDRSVCCHRRAVLLSGRPPAYRGGSGTRPDHTGIGSHCQAQTQSEHPRHRCAQAEGGWLERQLGLDAYTHCGPGYRSRSQTTVDALWFPVIGFFAGAVLIGAG